MSEQEDRLTMEPDLAARCIADALGYAADGLTDGAHHKQWVIDQMVRALTGCPMAAGTAIDCNGKPYTYTAQGESEAYRDWVAAVEDGDDGPHMYEWDAGIVP